MGYVSTRQYPSDMRAGYPMEHYVAEDEIIFRSGGPGQWYIYWGGGSDLAEGPFATRDEATRHHKATRSE